MQVSLSLLCTWHVALQRLHSSQMGPAAMPVLPHGSRMKAETGLCSQHPTFHRSMGTLARRDKAQQHACILLRACSIRQPSP